MPIRKDKFVADGYYHIYNRGVDKRIIFLDQEDYDHFVYLMYVCNSKKSIRLRELGKSFKRGDIIVNIGVFCLMPNHFHILVKENIQGGISSYVRKVLTAYSMYFNKKYNRSGSLFQGRFKSKYISNNNHFKYLYSYINLNPAKIIEPLWKEKIVKNKKLLLNYIFTYPYSSIKEYLSLKFHICNPTEFPVFFKNPQNHVDDLLEWLNYVIPTGPSYVAGRTCGPAKKY